MHFIDLHLFDYKPREEKTDIKIKKLRRERETKIALWWVLAIYLEDGYAFRRITKSNVWKIQGI